MSKRALCLASLLWVAVLPRPGLAWGPNGHQTVGAIADGLLQGTPAQKQVTKILGFSLQQASVWADCAKGVAMKPDGTFSYVDAGKYPECKPYETKAGEAAMVAYARRNWSQCSPAQGDDICHKDYHFTDVAIERDQYSSGFVGTRTYDIVAAINACIAVLKGSASPAPFSITSQREALLVLSHLVGDIHQPLHVAAVYLDAQGGIVDPDVTGDNLATHTRGANSLLDGTRNLHSEWDDVPASLQVQQFLSAGLAAARAVPATSGSLFTWSRLWAGETILVAAPAFAGVSYGQEDAKQHWPITLPAGYVQTRIGVQRDQLVRGGAHLAEVLRTIWP